MDIKIEKFSKWTHNGNGKKYTVIEVANEHSENPDYPLHVIYEGENGKIWAKSIGNFLARMKPYKEK